MKTKDAISRCLYIVRRLKRGQKATFSEIQTFLKFKSELTGEDYSISVRTFQRDMDTIRTLFGIDIVYDRKSGTYSLCENEDDGMLTERMLNTYDVFQSLKLIDNFSSVFHLESKTILGSEHLLGIIKAIQNKHLITIIYNKNWENNFATYRVLPLLLKEFRGRWYVVTMKVDTKETRTFSLDRISSFIIENQTANPPKDISHFFKYSFGIYGALDHSFEEVVLSFSPDAGRFVKESKLHHSQEVLIDNHIEFRIKLQILISFDLKMEIFGYGDLVEVISPLSLRNEFYQRSSKMIEKYKK